MRLRRTAHVVERGDRVFERLRTENDRERIARLLLVEIADENSEPSVGNARVLSRYVESKSQRRALARDSFTLRTQRSELGVRTLELRIDRVQIEGRSVDALRQCVVRVAQRSDRTIVRFRRVGTACRSNCAAGCAANRDEEQGRRKSCRPPHEPSNLTNVCRCCGTLCDSRNERGLTSFWLRITLRTSEKPVSLPTL